MHIGIIGAGHAGVEAAGVAAEHGATVTLLSAEPVLPYFRPRLVALAFGQTAPESIAIHPQDWYRQRKIDLRLSTTVRTMDLRTRSVLAGDTTMSFDAIIISAGSAPVVPGNCSCPAPGLVTPLWSVEHALHIRSQIRPGRRCVILGGGVLGIETALHAREAGLQVTVIEQNMRLMPRQFGPRASKTILDRLEARSISVRLGRTVIEATSAADDPMRIRLDDGEMLAGDMVIFAIGARPDLELVRTCGIEIGRGIMVDQYLMASMPHVYAAGDIIQVAGVTRCSVKEAVTQGRLAGQNAVAGLLNGTCLAYRPASQPVFFKVRDMEFYALGVPEGADYQEVCMDSAGTAFRAMILKDGNVVGVQMVGTREGFEVLAGKIKIID